MRIVSLLSLNKLSWRYNNLTFVIEKEPRGVSMPRDERRVPERRRRPDDSPCAFAGNLQTLESNRFQDARGSPAAQVQTAAAREFEVSVRSARRRRERSRVRRHAEPHTPDSIFPNNWVSFHADGTVVLYPMLAENRRRNVARTCWKR